MQVLVAFDGSTGAVAALEAAVRLTRPAGGHIVALRVLNPLTDATNIIAPTAAAALREAEKRERDRLAAIVEAMGDLEGVEVELVVQALAHGEDVPEHLVRAAREREVDFVAIASRRAAGVRGLVLGSVTQHVLRLSERPVLVVRPSA